jgi:hypothetical protein
MAYIVNRLRIWHFLLVGVIMLLVFALSMPFITKYMQVKENEMKHIVANKLNTDVKYVILDTLANEYYSESITKRIIKYKVIKGNDTTKFKVIYHKKIFNKNNDIDFEQY